MPGSQTIGRYQVQKLLGQGNMGSVYLAFDPNLRRPVAIKTIRTHLRRTAKDSVPFTDRFFREAQANSQLNHPGVINVYDSGIHNGEPFLVMEFVDGATLEDVLGGGLILEPMLRYRLLSQIAAGLDYAHERGIIHRDIKPTNVLVTREGHAKIVDFGMAKLKDSNLTTTGVFLGTPSYASPEQIVHGKIDHKADLFSFGIMAYEILTGSRPFPGENINSILYHIVHTAAELDFSAMDGDDEVVARLKQVFGRMLAKEPGDRYEHASDFVNDLEAALGMEPIKEWKPEQGKALIDWGQLADFEGGNQGPSLDETMLLEDPMASRINNPAPLLLGITGAILVLVVLILALPRGTAETPAEDLPPITSAEALAAEREAAENEALAAERADYEASLNQEFNDYIEEKDFDSAKEILAKMREEGFTDRLDNSERLLAALEKEAANATRERNKARVQNLFRTSRKNKNVSGMKRALTRYKREWPNDTVLIESWQQALAEEEAELNRLIEQDQRAFEQAMRDRDIEAAELQLYRLQRLDAETKEEAQRLKELKETTYINQLGMRFTVLQPGTFRMGPQSQAGKEPPYEVALTKSFMMGVHEVTQSQWQAVMGSNPSRVKDPGFPVHNISWIDARIFVDKLNAKDQDLVRYRLPTEAEWEYACRAGTTSLFGVGEALDPQDANFSSTGMDNPIQVGSYPPNPWGFFDMNGNVAEWVQDLHLSEWHRQTTDPLADNNERSGYRIHRGGSFDSNTGECACGDRSRRQARSEASYMGLRLVAERIEE